MISTDIDRVFGRGRLQMVTGEHVEVFREPAALGERRRYTKRFLATAAGDFRHWTEREWRILARLVGHGIGPVPDVVQFDRGAADRPAIVQTYDAGITVDHWATLLPVQRHGVDQAHVFEDCAHWWALAHHSLIALDAIHELQLVHLDLKADNVCIPYTPVDFDPLMAGQALRPRFEQISLIDFAFSLVSGESLTRALPIARQTEYDYQSPRLLAALEAGSRGDLLPTRQLDWRCDVYSLAAMLRRYLPDPELPLAAGWTNARLSQARGLVRRLLRAHDDECPARRPHAALMALTAQALDDEEFAASLADGWTLALADPTARGDSATPVTRIALPVSVAADVASPRLFDGPSMRPPVPRPGLSAAQRWGAAVALVSAAAVGAPMLYGALSAPSADVDFEVSPVLLADATQTSDVAALKAVPAVEAPVVEPNVAPASAPETAQAAVPVLSAPISAPAPATPAETKAAPDQMPAEPPVAAPAPEPAAAPAPGPAPAPLPSAARVLPRVATPALQPATAVAKSAPQRTAVTAPPKNAKERAAAARMQVAARAAPAAPVPVSASAPAPALTERQRVLAWLTLRGPTPLGAAATAAKSTATAMAATTAWPTAVPATASAAALAAPAPASTWPATASSSNTVLQRAPASGLAIGAGSAGGGSGVSAVNGVGVVSVVSGPTTGGTRVASTEPRAPSLPFEAMPVPVSRGETPDYAARASQLVAGELPRLAQRAERRVQRVFQIAASVDRDGAGQDEEIRRAASALREGPADLPPGLDLSADDAQTLHQSAQQAFWRRGLPREALDLQMKAFAANPLDADIAGSLAFLSLKQGAQQADRARQLALYALTLPGGASSSTRVELWTTLAIASGLMGREADARHAWFVSLALAAQPERQCRAAINAYTQHGERLRAPVEAMLYRASQSPRTQSASLCEWPPHWMASRR